MAMIDAQVALSAYTTLGLGGPVGQFIQATSDDELVDAARAADRAGEPVLVLGGGSNLVVADEGFPGTVVHVVTKGVVVRERGHRPDGSVPDDCPTVAGTAAAGERWDQLGEGAGSEGRGGGEGLVG